MKKIETQLNKQQITAATHKNGPMLILAGAGSGKTRVITYRVFHLITEYWIPAENILMCTFTNKAANEMQERIKKLLQTIKHHSINTPTAGTFHSVCARILRKHGAMINIPNNYVIYDTQDQLDTMKQVMKSRDISQKNYKPRSILYTISAAKNEMVSALEYANIAKGNFQETAARLYLAYEQILREQNALDFDDLLLYTIRLFTSHKEILGRFQEQFKYILIDEYQDTNTPQYTLTNLLASRYKNICVVGDASQSIYRWRGADFRNISLFKKDYPNAKIYNLEQNYRSTQHVLDAANGVISKNTTHPVLTLWTRQQKGEKITLYEARNEKDEAQYIVQTILQSNQQFHNFAVLYRTNAQSRVIEETFIKSGIPYVLVGGIRFYERKEIKDVLSYLRYASNPKDKTSLVRIEKIGKKRLKKFLEFLKFQQKENTLLSLTTLELLDKILEKTQYLTLYDPKNEEDVYRLENIKELRSVASEFPALLDFLENVALVQQEYYPDEIKQKDQKKDAVTLMTIHAAKGLEFDTVYLVGLEEGLFPHSKSLMEKEELEEERRLCYVGMTRAKNKLHLTHTKNRIYFGTKMQNIVSRFISDIPDHTLEIQQSLSPSRRFSADDYLI